eukprot:COSAG01_NODE_2588_length_7414_cov_4.548052_5_plen_381_part_00
MPMLIFMQRSRYEGLEPEVEAGLRWEHWRVSWRHVDRPSEDAAVAVAGGVGGRDPLAALPASELRTLLCATAGGRCLRAGGTLSDAEVAPTGAGVAELVARLRGCMRAQSEGALQMLGNGRHAPGSRSARGGGGAEEPEPELEAGGGGPTDTNAPRDRLAQARGVGAPTVHTTGAKVRQLLPVQSAGEAVPAGRTLPMSASQKVDAMFAGAAGELDAITRHQANQLAARAAHESKLAERVAAAKAARQARQEVVAAASAAAAVGTSSLVIRSDSHSDSDVEEVADFLADLESSDDGDEARVAVDDDDSSSTSSGGAMFEACEEALCDHVSDSCSEEEAPSPESRDAAQAEDDAVWLYPSPWQRLWCAASRASWLHLHGST